MTFAHHPVGPNEVAWAWNFEPLLISALTLAALAYLRGIRRVGNNGTGLLGRGRVAAFYAGLFVAIVVLISPFGALADTLFSAHMIQHLLLILCVAPLIVSGAPALPFLLCIPIRGRRWLQRRRHARALVLIGTPLVAWSLHTAAMWAWHHPALYESAIRNEALHVVEHMTFLGTAVLIWAIVIPAPRSRLRFGSAAGILFATALQGGALGAILTFATTELYTVHAAGARMWGLTLLRDQQLAGVIMWVPAGAVYFVAIAILFVKWLKDEPARNTRTPLMAGFDKR
jgi:putative membrane protein